MTGNKIIQLDEKFHNSILYSLHTRLQTITAIETTQNLSASAPTFQSAGKIPP